MLQESSFFFFNINFFYQCIDNWKQITRYHMNALFGNKRRTTKAESLSYRATVAVTVTVAVVIYGPSNMWVDERVVRVSFTARLSITKLKVPSTPVFSILDFHGYVDTQLSASYKEYRTACIGSNMSSNSSNKCTTLQYQYRSLISYLRAHQSSLSFNRCYTRFCVLNSTQK